MSSLSSLTTILCSFTVDEERAPTSDDVVSDDSVGKKRLFCS